MPTTTIRRLAIGERVTFVVADVRLITAGKWPEYEWVADDGTITTTPQAAADRQLETQIKMPLAQIRGHAITIERAPNKVDPKRSWWNFSLAERQQPSKRIPPPDTLKPSEREAADAFAQALRDDPHGTGEMRQAGEEPEEEPETEAQIAAKQRRGERERLRRWYETLRNAVADSQQARYGTHSFQMTEPVSTPGTAAVAEVWERIPFDAASVQSETATLWITWKDMGLLR